MISEDSLCLKPYGFDIQEILDSLLLPALFYSGRDVPLRELRLNEEALALMDEFSKALWQKLDQKPSRLYRLMTGKATPYTIVPMWIRDRLLRTRAVKGGLSVNDKIGLEKVRKRFLDAIGLRPETTKTICALTHDVDSERGLKRALRLKELEEKYNVESTWFLLTDEYRLGKETASRLAENGEVASHGDKHDGRFQSLDSEILIERLRRSRKKLEGLTECEVMGFRAPLLQYGMNMIKAVKEACFTYDSSMPTWEPVRPSTMKPGGVELTNVVRVHGILEVPVTITQDHQMLRILKLSPKQVVQEWKRLACELSGVGICIFLIHPDYELASRENLAYYEELLRMAKDMSPMRLSELVQRVEAIHIRW